MDRARVIYLANERRRKAKKERRKNGTVASTSPIIAESTIRGAEAHENFLNKTLPVRDQE